MFRSILNFLIIAALAALGVYGASYIKTHRIRLQPREKVEMPPVPVEAVRARAVETGALALVKGVVEPLRVAKVGPEVAGKVVYLAPGLDAGSVVREGQLLLRLDTELLLAEKKRLETSLRTAELGVESAELDLARIKDDLELARANLDVVRRLHERNEKLFQSGSLSESELDRSRIELIRARQSVQAARDGLALAEVKLRSARANVESVKAAIEKLETSIEKSSVHAPFSGVVASKGAEVGDYLAPGVPAFVLQQIDKVYFTASVPASEFLRLPPGSSASVTFYDVRGRSFEGKVAYLGVQPDPVSRSYSVKILLDNPDLFLRPGLFGEASLSLRPVRFALAVPSSAVQNDAGRYYVFVIEDGSVSLRYVKTGDTLSWTEILDGLREGELVAVSAFDRLFPGVKVRVVEGNSAAGER